MTIPAALRDSLRDRYRFEREVGRGGMATVYLADDLKHRRKVAIKVLKPALVRAIGLDRFLREIEIAARLSHPHILPLFDSGAADGLPFYVTPFVTGESLRVRLDREHRLPLEETLRLAHEIAGALAHAHRQGIVHRDIKPENILLADGIALVADFGIARVVPSPGTEPGSEATIAVATAAGAAIGTPRYMAPEQATGGEVDGRADLYSLACVLFEMLAGQPPFTGATSEALIRLHLNVPAAPITALRPGVPSSVAAAIARGLEKLPADRHANAARFAEALAAGARAPATTGEAGEPIVAPHNLPKPRTRFIGRERELAECARLLGDTRILTLTGVGGCGKTRLALELGAALLATWPDGVWFVDLAPVPESDRVALTVAETLGVKPEHGTPIVDTLVAHLAAKRLVLLLDNCEHLVGACSALADRLLATTEHLKFVATSREGLGVEGERLFTVRSLSVPDREHETDPAAVGRSDSARLFLDRARLVDDGFQLNGESAPAVAEICRRLDGIPLAIELAAARVKLLSVDEIRARLDDRFRLLTGGSKTSLPRHQTLRATIAWSYDQLPAEEQRLLRLLAVFVGGWTLPAATAVWGEDADEFAVLEHLGRLVDKSLVSVHRLPDHSSRYSMLETVRQFAQERLNETDEGNAARSRHLDHFIRFTAEADIHGPEAGRWRRRFDREQENLLAAHRWCDSDPDGGAKGLQLITNESSYWGDRGFIELGLELAESALRRPGAEQGTPQRAQALFRAGHLHHHLKQLDEAIRLGEEMRSIAEERDHMVLLTVALCHLSWTVQAVPDWPRARRYADEALAAARRSGRDAAVLRALNCSSGIDLALGDFATALPQVDEALQLARTLGSQEGIQGSLLARAQILISSGDLGAAVPALTEALEISIAMGPRLVQLALDVLACAAMAADEPARAARFFGRSEAVRDRMRLHREPVDAEFVGGWMDRVRSALGEPVFADAEAGGRALAWDEGLEEARAWLRTR